jgi:hypothetical protein
LRAVLVKTPSGQDLLASTPSSRELFSQRSALLDLNLSSFQFRAGD